MAWTGQTFTVGQILTANQMNNLQADITALANADTGAPDIGPAITAANAGAGVQRADLDTNTASTAGTINDVTAQDIALNAYAFFPMIHTDNQGNLHVTGHITDGADPDAPRFAFYNNSGSVKNYDVDYRYIQA